MNSITRRTFLQAAAAGGLATAAITILKPSVVRGAQANSKIRLGLIGCGGRGQWIADLFTAHGGYEIAGAADAFSDRTAVVAKKHGLSPQQTFTGLQCAEKMIAKGGLDAVAIISPPYFHPSQAAAAVEAGLHVYLAKPIAVDVPGCQSIRASGTAAGKKGLVFLVDFQTRANEFYVEAVRRVHNGVLGTIAFGEAKYHADRLKPKGAVNDSAASRLRNWVFDKALSGDIIVEQNIHTLDVMSWIMNTPPLRCWGVGGRKARLDVGDCSDYFTLTYEYPQGVGIAFSSRQFDCDAPGGIHNNMYGSKTALLAEYGGLVNIRGGEATFYRGKTSAIYKEGAVTNIKTFHESILAKNVANTTVEPSVLSNLVCIMGRTAAATGQMVAWDEILKSTEVLSPKLTGLEA